MTAILESHDGTEDGVLDADRLIQLSRTLRSSRLRRHG